MSFTYRGREYDYFEHPHNATGGNERTVEAPVAAHWLSDASGRRVLEVGNVLSHYEDRLILPERTIVDKYEQGDGVINCDVLEYEEHGWDRIVSISTLEHVDWEASYGRPIRADSARMAVRQLLGLLGPGGKFLLTIPMGYHPKFDDYLLALGGNWDFTVMVRDPDGWRESPERERRRYGAPFPCANSLWIGEYASA